MAFAPIASWHPGRDDDSGLLQALGERGGGRHGDPRVLGGEYSQSIRVIHGVLHTVYMCATMGFPLPCATTMRQTARHPHSPSDMLFDALLHVSAPMPCWRRRHPGTQRQRSQQPAAGPPDRRVRPSDTAGVAAAMRLCHEHGSRSCRRAG